MCVEVCFFRGPSASRSYPVARRAILSGDMKWVGVVSLIAVAAGCGFPHYNLREDEARAGSSGSDSGGMGNAATSGAGATPSGSNAGGMAATGGNTGGTSDSAGTGAAGGTGGTTTEVGPIGLPGNWQLTFEDEFEGNALDTTRWITWMRVGDIAFREWGGRDEWIADENVTVDDGYCVLTALDEDSNGHAFTSGAINSAGLFEQEFGFFEARIKLPLGRGFWGVWALRSLAGWPPAINGVQVLGGQPARALFSYDYQAEAGAESVRYEGTDDYTGSYHVYGIDWQPTQVAFYVDGGLIESLEDPDGRLTGPLYPGVNLSISSSDSGDPIPDETTPWPGEVKIDWIRVYQRLP